MQHLSPTSQSLVPEGWTFESHPVLSRSGMPFANEAVLRQPTDDMTAWSRDEGPLGFHFAVPLPLDSVEYTDWQVPYDPVSQTMITPVQAGGGSSAITAQSTSPSITIFAGKTTALGDFDVETKADFKDPDCIDD